MVWEIYLNKTMKTEQKEVALVFFSLVESSLVKNTITVWLAVLLISKDLSSSAEELKFSIANETSVELQLSR